MDSDTKLKKQISSNFPYTPYDIQLNFATSLYKALDERKKLMIFESPTGTGKSLSLICGAF